MWVSNQQFSAGDDLGLRVLILKPQHQEVHLIYTLYHDDPFMSTLNHSFSSVSGLTAQGGATHQNGVIHVAIPEAAIFRAV